MIRAVLFDLDGKLVPQGEFEVADAPDALIEASNISNLRSVTGMNPTNGDCQAVCRVADILAI